LVNYHTFGTVEESSRHGVWESLPTMMGRLCAGVL